MDKTVLSFVLKKIQAKGKIPEMQSLMDWDYRRAGYIDSIGIMKFVLEIEAEFDIEISEADMESPAFSTIGGLVAIIKAHLSKGT